MSIIPVTLGEAARLSLVLENGATDQYPRVNLYESGDPIPIATLDLDHLSEGLYEVSYTMSSLGIFNAVYTVYEDAARTTINDNYSKELDQLLVQPESTNTIDDLAEYILRVLGLVRENAFIDNTVYDDCDQLVSARFRIFDTASEANAATDGGSEAAKETYQITSDYESPGRMKTYRMVRL